MSQKKCIICKEYYDDGITEEPHVCSKEVIVEQVRQKYASAEFVDVYDEDEEGDEDDW